MIKHLESGVDYKTVHIVRETDGDYYLLKDQRKKNLVLYYDQARLLRFKVLLRGSVFRKAINSEGKLGIKIIRRAP